MTVEVTLVYPVRCHGRGMTLEVTLVYPVQ